MLETYRRCEKMSQNRRYLVDLDERKVFESINLYGGEDVAFFLLQLRMLINGV